MTESATLIHHLERTLIIGARRETVFRFFTDPVRWASWWGAGSTIEPHPSGRVLIRYPGGTEAVGEVLEIDPPERLVFTYGYAKGVPVAPGASLVTIALEDHGGSTRLRLTHAFSEPRVRDEHLQGWRYQLSLFANIVANELHGDSARLVDRWFAVWSEADAGTRESELRAIASGDIRGTGPVQRARRHGRSRESHRRIPALHAGRSNPARWRRQAVSGHGRERLARPERCGRAARHRPERLRARCGWSDPLGHGILVAASAGARVGRSDMNPVLTAGVAAALAAALTVAQAGVRSGRTTSGIAYDIQGSGPPVVLISGSNLDRRMWAAETDWLKRDFTVVRYDLRAHGQSDVPVSPFSHTDDLFSLLDELGIASGSLIGLSAGATIALDAALQAPKRVTRVVLTAPAISGYVPKERPAFFTDLIAALQARDFIKAQEVMLASPLFDVPTESRQLVRTMVTENGRLWTVPRELLKTPSRPAAERLKDVAVPTLVLVGERDLAAQREQAVVLERQLPGATLVVVPAGGHMLNLTSPEAFRSAVSSFLRAGKP